MNAYHTTPAEPNVVSITAEEARALRRFPLPKTPDGHYRDELRAPGTDDEPDWLRLHAESPGHHYTLDDCRRALAGQPRRGWIPLALAVVAAVVVWIAVRS